VKDRLPLAVFALALAVAALALVESRRGPGYHFFTTPGPDNTTRIYAVVGDKLHRCSIAGLPFALESWGGPMLCSEYGPIVRNKAEYPFGKPDPE